MNSKNQKKTKIKAKELEKLKEDEIIEILNEDLNLIKKIKNPSLKIQKMVVNKDVDYFKFIKTPDISIIEFVAKIKPSLLREDMFDIESVQNILIKNNPRYAKKFTKMSESIKEKVAKTIPNLLNYENNEKLQRIAFEESSLSYKYFKDCAFISNEEVMDKNPGLFVYIKNIDKNLISENIRMIYNGLYEYIEEYTKEMIEHMLLGSSRDVSYLNYEKMMKVEDWHGVLEKERIHLYKNMFHRIPYKAIKTHIQRQGNLCDVTIFENDDEILDAIESNEAVVKFLRNIPESVLLKISKDIYPKINYFGEISKEFQLKLLTEDIKYAGKIKNLDLDLVKKIGAYDDRILRYSRVMDDELKIYGISNGIFNYKELSNLDKNQLVKAIFICNQFREGDNCNVKMVR